MMEMGWFWLEEVDGGGILLASAMEGDIPYCDGEKDDGGAFEELPSIELLLEVVLLYMEAPCEDDDGVEVVLEVEVLVPALGGGGGDMDALEEEDGDVWTPNGIYIGFGIE
jgi:hypothetical protein